VATQFLDAEARAAFARAVDTIENGSAVEVVIAVRQRSGTYRHANVVVAAIVAFAGLAVMLFTEQTFGLASVLVDPFVVALLAGLLVELLPQVKRGLTSRARLRADVLRAARATFVERGVHATTGRSGVLVYVSWLEQELALVPDLGLAAQLPEGALAAAEDKLRGVLAAGGSAVAAELERLAAMLTSAMPHRADDVNELPDAIDSDLKERER
jgi:putative membrane protein